MAVASSKVLYISHIRANERPEFPPEAPAPVFMLQLSATSALAEFASCEAAERTRVLSLESGGHQVVVFSTSTAINRDALSHGSVRGCGGEG